MPNDPHVSVIIPAYNAEETIAECLNSLLNQTLHDIEIIVVDDGSTDNTAQIVEDYLAKDSRVQLIRQENQFAGVARNNGMKHATGQYLYFLDADDYIEPSCLSDMCHIAVKYNTDVVITRSVGFEAATNQAQSLDYALSGMPMETPLGPSDISPTLFQSFIGWPWDKLFRHSFITDNQLTFQNLRTSNDALFVFLALALAKRLYCIEKPLVHHRMNNPDSLEGSRGKSYKCALEAMHAIKKELVKKDLFPSTENSFNQWVANFIFWNISTLAPDAANDLLLTAEGDLMSLPSNSDYYDNQQDAEFIRIINLSYAELIVESVNNNTHLKLALKEIETLQKELEGQRGAVADLKQIISDLEKQLNNIYSSKSYKIGNTLIRPAHMIKEKLKHT